MKKLFLITLALVTIQVSAQNKKQGERNGDRMEKGQSMKDLTPEEMAQLQTKKMTLALDLTASQQKQVQALQLENAKARKAKMEERQAKMKDGTGPKRTKEERVAMMNERLDNQLAMKKKMKNILNEEQLVKWEKMNARKEGRHPKKGKEKRMQKS